MHKVNLNCKLLQTMHNYIKFSATEAPFNIKLHQSGSTPKEEKKKIDEASICFINWFMGNFFEILGRGGGGGRKKKKKSLKLISR